jgi:hypothetical protein
LPIPEPDIRADADRRGTDALTDANRRELRVLDLPPPQTFTQSLLLNIPCRITPATQSDDHAACWPRDNATYQPECCAAA